MRAIVQDVYGPADVLELREIDRPVARDDEVLLRVHAAGVGPEVWHLMMGLPYMVRLAYGHRRPRSPVRGSDAAGRVEAVGAKVTRFKPGDEVFGACDGSFAEYARAEADKLAPKPRDLSFEQAAAVPVSGATALQALRDKARVQPGQKVLVIGASGGVGTFAVQLAAAYDADVTGVCGPTGAGPRPLPGRRRRHRLHPRGDHRPPRPLRRHPDAAGSRPVSLLRRALAPRGTLIIVDGEGAGRWLGVGRQVRARLATPFLHRSLATFVATTRDKDLKDLTALLETGALTPIIDRTYDLAAAPAAVRHLQEGNRRGKIVLTI